jgi:hypothetical protein
MIIFSVTFAAANLALARMAIKRGRQGIFLSLFLAAMILFYLFAAALPLKDWENAIAPLLLLVGLLTLLNAPFDWASLGLTRALPRPVARDTRPLSRRHC